MEKTVCHIRLGIDPELKGVRILYEVKINKKGYYA